MKVLRTTPREMQLDQYVDLVPKIYGRNDVDRSIWDVWCHTLHHAAAIAEAIRRNASLDKLSTEIADCALWLFTIVHKFSGEFGAPKLPEKDAPETLIRIQSSCSDLLWHKYPGLCPVCYVRKTAGDRKRETVDMYSDSCDCPLDAAPSRNIESKIGAMAALRSFSEERLANKPKTIDEWQQMFGKIFGKKLESLSLADITLHFMEELGEISDAMVRMYSYKAENFIAGEPYRRQRRLEAQVADAFSWLFSLVEKVKLPQDAEGAAKSIFLSQIIWNRYGSDALHSFWCPFCRRTECECELIFIPARRSVKDFKSLLEQRS